MSHLGIEYGETGYRYRGWVGRFDRRNEWRPAPDPGTLYNLWMIAADQADKGGYTSEERVQVQHRRTIHDLPPQHSREVLALIADAAAGDPGECAEVSA